jgi:integrase/recombinase XerC
VSRYLRDEDLRRLLRAARERIHVNALRDYSLLAVLANLGMRPGEAVQITASDLHLEGERPWLRVRRLKKRTALGVIDDLPLAAPLARLLRRYSCSLGRELAADVRIYRLTVRQVERLFHYYVRRAAIVGEFRLYALRHTAATRALEASGGDLRAVQLLLGHSRVTTTQVYAHVSPERRHRLAELVSVI